MSIQTKKYTSKKTGKTTTKYYAVVFSSSDNKPIWGPGRKTERQAKQDEAELMIEIDSGKFIATKFTFNDIAEQWLLSAANQYADTTYRGYVYYYHKYIENVFADKQIEKIQPIHIERYKNEMLKTYAPETVNSCFTVLSGIFQYGITLHANNSNPVRDVKRANVKTPDIRTWNEDEISYFLSLDLVKASPYYDMLFLSLTTAMRPSEVCGLTIHDFIPEKGILTVTQGLNQYGNVTDLKNTSSHRPIEISDTLISMLNNRILAKKKLRLLNQEECESNEYIFTQSNGKRILPGVYSKNFRKLIIRHNKEVDDILERCGVLPEGLRHLEQIRLYDIRHSFATNTLSSRVPVKVVSEVMGHAKVQTTLERYCHIRPSMHRDTINNYTEKITGKIS